MRATPVRDRPEYCKFRCMTTTTAVARWLVRILGIILIILGVLFWTGHALQLVPLHMLLGLLFVLALWLLAGVAFRAGGLGGFASAVVVWGIIVLVFGMGQRTLMPGGAHWVIQVLHLLIGLAAMGVGDRLAGRLTGRAAVAPQGSAAAGDGD